MNDGFGQQVTLSTPATVDSWTEMQRAFLAHSAATPTHLGAVLEAAPDFALGHAVKGMFCTLLGRPEMVADAQMSLVKARTAQQRAGSTERERRYVDALDIWLAGRPTMALQHFAAILRDHPDDPLAMKLDHALRFVLGDSKGMRASLEQIMPAYGHDHPARGYLLGCYAFALEETGDYTAARAAGRQGLDLAPDDAWGLHAVAHVHDMVGDAKGGLDWLTGREAAWAHCNNFRYHVWWHKALMHLDQGQIDEVLALYDTEVRADKTDDYRDISNGTSLLMRLELEGVDVGNRWDEMAELSANRTEDGCLIFADLHYLLALSGGRKPDAMRKMIGRIHNDAKRNATDMDQAMAQPGMAAATGLEAFGEGRYAQAFLSLHQAHKTMAHAGGSHAQRDVFERMTIDAGIRAGFFDQAEQLLAERTTQRANTLDGYAAARHELIAQGREAAYAESRLPAE
ncbi:MAG: tetratricopeptide repeat protein [Pseudomonadota bacterium]